MSKKIIYYPTINIPKSDWLYKAVMYWDEVGSLVPTRYGEEPNLLNKDNEAFVRAGLISRIDPFDSVREYPEFVRCFIANIERPNFKLRSRREAFTNGETFRLHANKFERQIFEELETRGLAKRGKHWEPWFHVEASTAKLLMTLLANVIALHGNYDLGSNQIENFNMGFKPSLSGKKKDMIRTRVLKDIMPYINDAKPDELASFKHDNITNLRNFRGRVERVIVQIAQAGSEEDQRNMHDVLVGELLAEKEHLSNLMNESKLGRAAQASFAGVVASEIVYLYADNPILSIAPLLTAIGAGYREYKKPIGENNQLRYLALMDSNF